MNKCLPYFLAILITLFTISASAQKTHYVTVGGTGTIDGTTWKNASGDLQNMINSSKAGDQIWVASGTYYPVRRADNTGVISINDRDNAFVLKKDVKIYGGFKGIADETELTQRDSTGKTNATILSGNIGSPDSLDNAYHVVISAGAAGSAELNGFTIKEAEAVGSGAIYVSSLAISHRFGGGIHLNQSSPALTNLNIVGNNAEWGGGINMDSSSPVLKNINIKLNYASSSGGGILNKSSSPILTNVSICENIGDGNGGAMFNIISSRPDLINVIIIGNKANVGGGIYNQRSFPILTNVTMSANISIAKTGGGMYNTISSSPKIRNSIIYGNSDGIYNDNNSVSSPEISYSLVQELTDEKNGNINGNKDPLFISATNFRLQAGSPAIERGNNAYFSKDSIPDLSEIKTDMDGNNRIKGTVDPGAYEFNSYPAPVTIVDYTARIENNKAKLKWSTAVESNNAAFIISRSADGKNFTEIGKVAGVGNSTLQNDYVFYDENPLYGINFYRLEQIDYDGRKTYLGVRIVNSASVVNNFIKVYPNPVKNLVRIKFTANTYHQLELTDVSGKELQHIPLSTLDSEKKMDMSNLASGVYFIKLTGNDKVESRKVVKE